MAAVRRFAYCLVNFSVMSLSPNTSWSTSTWPSHDGPAPMPMVGIDSFG